MDLYKVTLEYTRYVIADDEYAAIDAAQDALDDDDESDSSDAVVVRHDFLIPDADQLPYLGADESDILEFVNESFPDELKEQVMSTDDVTVEVWLQYLKHVEQERLERENLEQRQPKLPGL